MNQTRVPLESENDLTRLYRLAQGSYSEAFKLVYGTIDLGCGSFALDNFDMLCTHYNGGVEVEWLSK